MASRTSRNGLKVVAIFLIVCCCSSFWWKGINKHDDWNEIYQLTDPRRYIRRQARLLQTIDDELQEHQQEQIQQDLNQVTYDAVEIELGAGPIKEQSTSTTIVINVTFEDMLRVVIFLLVTWICANISNYIGFPTLVGEIIAGIVLGPPVLDFCPYPDAMVLIGNFGLIGLILNSGIDLDIAQLKDTGTRAICLAICGTVLALGAGLGVGSISPSNTIISALAVGAAFAPSSWGVASQVLSKGEFLNTVTGQLIVATSVVDDILGLIMLSILQVFVKESPTTFDFIKPFLASFGHLIVLGGIGILIIPRVMQHYVLPQIQSESHKDWVSIGIMFCLLIVYMPLMNYTGASYLTGAFLAGVSFSQLHHVHATFATSTKEVMVWLMRIFFAATIGFQVPVKYFHNPTVLLWGAKFLIPVLAKLPLGLLVRSSHHHRDNIPDDFPYDPYWRDVLITALSMTCRGEFNFVVASFGLSSGLIDSKQYASIVLAVLVSSVVAPLILTRVLQYYNTKSIAYLDSTHPVKRIDGTCDGYRPLFLAIQARTPVQWGMQEKFRDALESSGLVIIDHRYWHTLGLSEAVNITEIFCQDKRVRVQISGCFVNDDDGAVAIDDGDEAKVVKDWTARHDETSSSHSFTSPNSSGVLACAIDEDGTKSVVTASSSSSQTISKRLDEVRKTLIDALTVETEASSLDYKIQVSQWKAFSFEDATSHQPVADDLEQQQPITAVKPESIRRTTSQASRRDQYSFHLPQSMSFETDDFVRPIINADGNVGIRGDHSTTARGHHRRESSGSLFRRFSSFGSTASNHVSNQTQQGNGEDDHHHERVKEDPYLSVDDLWETDEICHNAARDGYILSPEQDGSLYSHHVSVTEGCRNIHAGDHYYLSSTNRTGHERDEVRLPSPSPSPPQQQQQQQQALHQSGNRRRHNTFDASALHSYNVVRSNNNNNYQIQQQHDIETFTIKERLHGYVRP